MIDWLSQAFYLAGKFDSASASDGSPAVSAHWSLPGLLLLAGLEAASWSGCHNASRTQRSPTIVAQPWDEFSIPVLLGVSPFFC